MNTDSFRELFFDLTSKQIDIAVSALCKDVYYAEHKSLIEQSISKKDIDSLLSYQMTLHNMELEAAYRAGHRDCISYLREIDFLTKPQA